MKGKTFCKFSLVLTNFAETTFQIYKYFLARYGDSENSEEVQSESSEDGPEKENSSVENTSETNEDVADLSRSSGLVNDRKELPDGDSETISIQQDYEPTIPMNENETAVVASIRVSENAGNDLSNNENGKKFVGAGKEVLEYFLNNKDGKNAETESMESVTEHYEDDLKDSEMRDEGNHDWEDSVMTGEVLEKMSRNKENNETEKVDSSITTQNDDARHGMKDKQSMNNDKSSLQTEYSVSVDDDNNKKEMVVDKVEDADKSMADLKDESESRNTDLVDGYDSDVDMKRNNGQDNLEMENSSIEDNGEMNNGSETKLSNDHGNIENKQSEKLSYSEMNDTINNRKEIKTDETLGKKRTNDRKFDFLEENLKMISLEEFDMKEKMNKHKKDDMEDIEALVATMQAEDIQNRQLRKESEEFINLNNMKTMRQIKGPNANEEMKITLQGLVAPRVGISTLETESTQEIETRQQNIEEIEDLVHLMLEDLEEHDSPGYLPLPVKPNKTAKPPSVKAVTASSKQSVSLVDTLPMSENGFYSPEMIEKVDQIHDTSKRVKGNVDTLKVLTDNISKKFKDVNSDMPYFISNTQQLSKSSTELNRLMSDLLEIKEYIQGTQRIMNTTTSSAKPNSLHSVKASTSAPNEPVILMTANVGSRQSGHLKGITPVLGQDHASPIYLMLGPLIHSTTVNT